MREPEAGKARRDGTRERVNGAAFRTRPVVVMQTDAQNWAVEEHIPRMGDEAGALWATEEQRLRPAGRDYAPKHFSWDKTGTIPQKNHRATLNWEFELLP